MKQKFSIIFSFLLIQLVASIDDDFVTKSHTFIVPENLEAFKAQLSDDILGRNGRISGGRPVPNNLLYPFVGEITMTWHEGGPTRCTSSLIATNWVISGRGCLVRVTNQVARSIMLEIGSHLRQANRQAAFANFATWVDSSTELPSPDFSLIRLNVNLQLSATVNIVRLPTMAQIDEWFERRFVTFIGWGETSPGQTANNLHFANLLVKAKILCNTQFVPTITINELCTEASESSARMLTGDEGGPLVFDEAGSFTLIGVASANHASNATTDGNSIGFTRIGQFLDFILSTTGIPPRT